MTRSPSNQAYNLPWKRLQQVERVRTRIWRHISPVSEFVEELHPEAGDLLHLTPSDLVQLARLHFVVSAEVGTFLADLPHLARRLATTTVSEEEWSLDRIRGSIAWSRTIGARAATGLPHLYVTAPAARAYQTPENELLAFVLDAIVRLGRDTRLAGARSGIGAEITRRTDESNSWRRRRAINEIVRRPPTPRSVARIRSGRHRLRYRPAIAAYERYRSLYLELDPREIQRVIEERAIAITDDPTIFEIVTTFDIIEALEESGWRMSKLGLFGAPRRLTLTGRRGDDRLRLWYQHSPKELSAESRYHSVLSGHGIGTDWTRRRPDLILRISKPGRADRWFLVEVKLGERRTVAASSRAALADLLSYRRDFSAALSRSEPPYGLGIAWGANLAPAMNDECLLATPDRIGEALQILVGR